MAYVYNGFARKYIIKVQTLVNNVVVQTVDENLLLEFEYNQQMFPGLTTTQLARLNTVDFYNRVTSFSKYLENKHPGLSIDVDSLFNELEFVNETLCPVNQIV